jgi:hypothetical protein
LIPFVAKQAQTDRRACEEAVDFFETKMDECEPYLRELRKAITEKRRRTFREQRIS